MTGVAWDEDRLIGRWALFADQENHGWIEWHGGDAPPLATGSVDVRLRSGRLILFRSPLSIGGRSNPGGNWVHLQALSDIIAYRPHPAEEPSGDRNEVLPF